MSAKNKPHKKYQFLRGKRKQLGYIIAESGRECNM